MKFAKEVLDQIRELTRINHHTEARIAIATHAKNCGMDSADQYEHYFLSINEVETLMGMTTQEMMKLISNLTEEMMEDIENSFGSDDKIAINKCL